MNKMTLAIGAIACLCLAGCSGTSGPAPTAAAETVTANSESALSTTVPTGGLSQSDVVPMIRASDAGYYDGRPDADILHDARSVCAIFSPSKGGDGTAQWISAVKLMIGLGMDAGASGSFITYSVSMSCPQELSYLPRG